MARFPPQPGQALCSQRTLATLQMKQSKSAYYGLKLVGEETEGCLILEKDVQQAEDDQMAYTVYFQVCFVF